MKKFMALATAILMVVAIIPVFAVSTSAAAWDGTTATEFEGKGTGANPYVIDTAEKLASLAKQVNDGDDFLGCYFTQTADIDLGDKEWTPIGNSGAPFSGVYDGMGHTIKGLKITDPDQNHVGLFGYLAPDFKKEVGIMNLTLEGNIEIDNTTKDSGLGSVVGWMYKDSETGVKPLTLINVTSNVNFKITNCAKQPRMGGVVGYAFESTLINVVYNGTIDYQGSAACRVGGICGQSNRTEFRYCVNNGKINVALSGATSTHCGGICGMTTFKIQDMYTFYNGCVNNGEYTATSESGKVYIGGIVGATYSSATDYYIKAVNCLNTGKLYAEVLDKNVVDKFAYVGGIFAFIEKPSAYAEGCVNVSNDITGTSAGQEIAGGIIGYIGGTALANDTVYATGCLNLTTAGVGVEAGNKLEIENGASDAKLDPAKAAILANCVEVKDAKINGFPGAAEDTTKPVETTNDPSSNTTAPVEDDTTAPAEDDTTAAPKTDDTTAAPKDDKKSGCGGFVSMGVALVAILGAAYVAKKH